MDRITSFLGGKGRASALLFFIYVPRLGVQIADLKRKTRKLAFVLSNFLELQKCHTL